MVVCRCWEALEMRADAGNSNWLLRFVLGRRALLLPHTSFTSALRLVASSAAHSTSTTQKPPISTTLYPHRTEDKSSCLFTIIASHLAGLQTHLQSAQR